MFQFILRCHGALIADNAVVTAVGGHAGPFPDQSCVDCLHGQMVAIAQDRQHVLHVMPFRKLRIGALGKAVANDAVLLVVRAAAHSEGLREPFDLLDPDIVGFLKNLTGQFIVRLPVQIEYFAHQVEGSEKALIDVLLHFLQRRLVRNDRIPGKDQDRVVNAGRDLQTNWV